MGTFSGLALECRPGAMAGATRASTSPDDSTSSRSHRLRDCLDALEEERRKIDAFRRELPLCMQLLHDAIESQKEKLAACRSSAREWPHAQMPAPLNESHSRLASPAYGIVADDVNLAKKTYDLSLTHNLQDDSVQKPDLMAMPVCLSFQGESYSHSQGGCQTDLAERVISRHHNYDQAFSASSKPLFFSKTKSGGAFTPFSRDKQVVQPTARMGSFNPADLAVCLNDYGVDPKSGTSDTLLDPPKGEKQGIVHQHCKDSAVKGAVDAVNGNSDGQPVRKVRRCWSPELHRRFVNALEQLGGSQVATPKQIRELMNVDGLTNDEVKSHLQKYRLHTRRPNPTHNATAQRAQVVVVGGIWVPPEYNVQAAAQQASGLYNTSQKPLLCHTASSQDFCSEMGSVEQMHFQSSPFNRQNSAAAQSSQSSLHGSSQLAGHSSLLFHELADTRREESVCDDEGSDNSSCKGGQWRYKAQEISEPEDDRSQGDSISGFQSHCTSEEEGSGGGITRGKIA